jgi:hypothetical protein
LTQTLLSSIWEASALERSKDKVVAKEEAKMAEDSGEAFNRANHLMEEAKGEETKAISRTWLPSTRTSPYKLPYQAPNAQICVNKSSSPLVTLTVPMAAILTLHAQCMSAYVTLHSIPIMWCRSSRVSQTRFPTWTEFLDWYDLSEICEASSGLEGHDSLTSSI